MYVLANLNQNAFLMELSPYFLVSRVVLKEYFENTRKLVKSIEDRLPRLQPQYYAIVRASLKLDSSRSIKLRAYWFRFSVLVHDDLLAWEFVHQDSQSY